MVAAGDVSGGASGVDAESCGVVNGSADCELRCSEKTARNEGWRRYSGNNSPSSGSSDNRYFQSDYY